VVRSRQRRPSLGHQWQSRLDHAAVVARPRQLGKRAAGPFVGEAER
jgi:hypothetical protein